MKKDAFYFSHDANAQSDPKILRLLSKHSWHGYGLFWAIVEMLRNEPNYKLETDYKTYAFALRTDSEGIRSVIEDFGLFVIEGGFFHSESLFERMQLKDNKSMKAAKAANIRWGREKEKQRDSADALHTDSDSNAKKGKERKEKKKKETTEYSERFLLFWKEYPKKLGKFDAYKNWKKHKCDNGQFEAIMESLAKQQKSKGWIKDDGKFIPQGDTWVRNRRWEDDDDEQPQDDWEDNI